MRRQILLIPKTMILRAPLRFALPGLLALLAGLPAGSAAPGFDPARVRSRSCKAPGWVCGFQPSTADDLAAVPVANSLLEAPAHPGGRSRLPARVDLGAQMPPVGDQGPRASGVAWALAYGLMSHGRASRDSDPNPISNAGSIVQAPGRGNASRKPCVAEAPDADQLYSPAHLYNALNMGKDAGIDLLRAGRYLVRQGAVDCSAVPYDPDTFEIAPAVGAPESSTNARFRARGLRRLAPSNLAEIQARLARGQAVAIGLSIYEDFYELGRGVYEAPPADLRARSFRGGHAVVLVGYDHNKKSAGGDAGAFRFLNSFSRDWGDQGYGWISYRAFHKLVREAVILDFADSDSLEFASGATVAPGAPAEVEATRGHFVDRIVVQYSASPGAVAYEISRAWPRALGGKNADRDADPFETIGYSRTPVFVDRTVQPEVAFRYRVRAIGVAGVSSRSVAIAEGFATKTGAKNKLPLRAVGLRALARVADIAADQAHVQLAWNPAMGARAYRVMRFEADRNRWRVLSRSQTQTEYLDRRPQRGVWNVYRVQALNDAGSAPWSESARVLIGGAGMAPGMVTRTRASRGSYGGRVDVVWDAVP
ncbi:MAG: C1 family peptidase, partial [Leptospirales bacterium]